MIIKGSFIEQCTRKWKLCEVSNIIDHFDIALRDRVPFIVQHPPAPNEASVPIQARRLGLFLVILSLDFFRIV